MIALVLVLAALFELAAVLSMHPLAAPHVPSMTWDVALLAQPASLLVIAIACDRGKIKPGWDGAGVPAMLALGWSWSFGLLTLSERLGLPAFPVDLAPSGDATPPHWFLMFAVGGVLLFWMAASGLYGPVLRPLARRVSRSIAASIALIAIVGLPLGAAMVFAVHFDPLLEACAALSSAIEGSSSGRFGTGVAVAITLVPIALHLLVERFAPSEKD